MDMTQRNELPLVIYDCFTDQQFGGNVGGIVLAAHDLKTEQMQQVARELNAPVTGFVTGKSGNDVTVRFFMATTEIAMCGHVAVGLFSHLSANTGTAAEQQFVMKTQASDVPVHVQPVTGKPPLVMMQLGLPKVEACDVDLAELADILGLPVENLATRAPVDLADAGLRHLCVHLQHLGDVQNLKPDFRRLGAFSKTYGVQTVACFSMETLDPTNTLHIRDFCPAVGADEVPASGTTNGALAGYLLRQGFIEQETETIRAEQGHEIGRPSLVQSNIQTKGALILDLWVGGNAVASIRGVLMI